MPRSSSPSPYNRDSRASSESQSASKRQAAAPVIDVDYSLSLSENSGESSSNDDRGSKRLTDLLIPLRSITFVGSGHMTAALVAKIVLRNRELSNDEKVKISILGRGKSETSEAISERKESETLEAIPERKESETLEAMRKNGIKVIFCEKAAEGTNPSKWTEVTISPNEIEKITSNIDDIAPNQDSIIIATKAYDHTPELFKNFSKIIKKRGSEDSNSQTEKPNTTKTTVVFAQNGIPCWFYKRMALQFSHKKPEVLDRNIALFDAIGQDAVVMGCVLNIACSAGKDGSHVVYTPSSQIKIPIGCYDGKERTKASSPLKRLLRNIGISPAMDKEGIMQEVLIKLQLNAAINGVSTITGKTIGELLDDKDLKRVVFAIAGEVDSLARSINPTYRLRDERALKLRLEPSRNHQGSMLEDFKRGKPLEIDAIYTSIIEISENYPVMNPPVFTKKVQKLLQKMQEIRDKEKLNPDNVIEQFKREVSDLISTINDRLAAPTTPSSGDMRQSFSRISAAVSRGSGEEVRVLPISDRASVPSTTTTLPEGAAFIGNNMGKSK